MRSECRSRGYHRGKLVNDPNQRTWFKLSETWGFPVWFCKLICPSFEFTQWKTWFALKWKRCDIASYEAALTRMYIAQSAGNKHTLEDCMLSKVIREPAKDWDWMTDEEREDAIRRSKAAHGFKG
jgi:hypothetical protein